MILFASISVLLSFILTVICTHRLTGYGDDDVYQLGTLIAGIYTVIAGGWLGWQIFIIAVRAAL